MSKERLEEIVEKIAEQLYDRIVVPETKVTIESQDIKYLFNTIEEQAERVQELEEDYEYLSHHYELETEQNKHYRDALIKTRYAIHTQISSINHQENTELENQYIRGMTFASAMINRYFNKILEGEE